MKKLLFLVMSFLSMTFLVSSCIKELKTEPDHSVKITFNSATFAAGTTKQLVCQNYSANELTWTSTDSTVAAVNITGLIIAYKAGTTTITVKSNTYNVSATCAVTVIEANATDVGVGADGSVFVVGNDSVSATGGYGIYKYLNGGLHKLPDCAAIRVAVSPQGIPWVVNKSHLIFKYNGTTWDQLPGTATDIGIGADGSVFTIGTQPASVTGGNNIQKWNGSGWTTLPDCAGIHISVAPNGIPWVVNSSNIVFQYGGTYLWNPIDGVQGNDIGIGPEGSVYVTQADAATAGFVPLIYKYNGSSWTAQTTITGGVSIAVGPQGKVWYIDKLNVLHKPS